MIDPNCTFTLLVICFWGIFIADIIANRIPIFTPCIDFITVSNDISFNIHCSNGYEFHFDVSPIYLGSEILHDEGSTSRTIC